MALLLNLPDLFAQTFSGCCSFLFLPGCFGQNASLFQSGKLRARHKPRSGTGLVYLAWVWKEVQATWKNLGQKPGCWFSKESEPRPCVVGTRPETRSSTPNPKTRKANAANHKLLSLQGSHPSLATAAYVQCGPWLPLHYLVRMLHVVLRRRLRAGNLQQEGGCLT